MTEQLASIVLYLAVFSLSLLFFWLAEGQYRRSDQLNDGLSKRALEYGRRNAFIGHICALVGILIVCLLAALRSTSVGVDTKGYPVLYTDIAAESSDFISFLLYSSDVGGEPLGALIIWACSKLDLGIIPLLFSYQLLTVVPVFLAVRRFKSRIPLSFAMSVYLFCFYNNSLNMMRQSVACALILLAFSIFLNSRRIDVRFIVLCVAAILFHRASIYGLFLMIPVFLIMKSRFKRARIILYVLVAIFPLFFSQISIVLVNLGIADSHMQYYLGVFINGTIDRDWFVDPLSLYSLAFLIIYSTLVFIPIIFSSHIVGYAHNGNNDKSVLSILEVLIPLNLVGYLIYVVLLFSLNTMYGIRFSLFFDFFLILSIPLSCEGGLYRHKKWFVITALIVFWLVWVIRLGWSGSAIYQFCFELA